MALIDDFTEAKALVDCMQSGTVWHFKRMPNEIEVIHIRSVVDDEYIVYRVWSTRKRHWRYHIDWRYLFELYAKDGLLECVGRVENVK